MNIGISRVSRNVYLPFSQTNGLLCHIVTVPVPLLRLFQGLALILALTVPAIAEGTNSSLKPVGPGLFELGKVRLDKNNRTVSFPAVLNLSPGLIEYVVVTETGKIHESLFRTEAEPFQIHTAMLLLGAKGAGTNRFPEQANQPLPGNKVTIEVTWRMEGGARQNRRAEELVYNQQTKSTMSRGPWIYNGSRMFDGTFVAQQDGSIVSLIEDPDALINNPRLGRESDEIWEVKTNGLPPLNSPVEIKIKVGQ